MEEMHRNHKEPAWGWMGLALSAAARLRRHARRDAGLVATPWGHVPGGRWTA